jgi:hypothetical protein
LYLQSSSNALLGTKWKWVYCRIAAAPANQQQQQLLVYDSIESSSDPASQPLETIALQSARCFAQLEQVSGGKLTLVACWCPEDAQMSYCYNLIVDMMVQGIIVTI